MRIDIQYLNTEPDWEAKKYISEKLNKLQSRYDWITDMNVYMKKENNDTGKNKIIELKLYVTDATLFSEARGENFHLAAKDAIDGMEKQLNKYQTRKTSQHLERKSLHNISPAV